MLPRNHVIGAVARQVETSEAGKPIDRGLQRQILLVSHDNHSRSTFSRAAPTPNAFETSGREPGAGRGERNRLLLSALRTLIAFPRNVLNP